MHIHLHDAWSVFVAVLAASVFYAVLRTLGVPWIHAWLIAALTIVFPWSDATRFWMTGDQVNLSIAIMGAGLLLALAGLKRNSWRHHAGAAALYLVSILTYEVTLPLIACMGFLYWLRAGWRAARYRWLTDLAVVVVAGSWVGSHTKRTTSGLGYDFEHLGEIVVRGGTILGRAGMPLGPPDDPRARRAGRSARGGPRCVFASPTSIRFSLPLGIEGLASPIGRRTLRCRTRVGDVHPGRVLLHPERVWTG